MGVDFGAPGPVASAPPCAPHIELRNISKAFPGVQALDDVSFAIRTGEGHMLLGENSAGKSTLMKVLCGTYRPDAGAILHDGQPVQIRSPNDARDLGIAVIFQDFTLVPCLDIAREYLSRPGISWSVS